MGRRNQNKGGGMMVGRCLSIHPTYHLSLCVRVCLESCCVCGVRRTVCVSVPTRRIPPEGNHPRTRPPP